MSLIPVGVQYVHPESPFNSADLPAFIAGTDGLDYVAKLSSPENPCLAAAEAVAYWLCGRLGMAVPASAWLEFPDGRVAFGSRWEVGVSQFSRMDADERQQAFIACRAQVARFCLLDAFLANSDRHADNLLFRRSPLDQRWTVISMDFSRALWRGGFPSTPVSATFDRGNTADMAHLVRVLGAFEATMITAIVAGLQAINANSLESLIAEFPPAAQCTELLRLPDWWASSERTDRANALLDLLP